MKFFVDTAEIDDIKDLAATGMVDGVTTNPSLIMKSGRDIIEVTKEICSIVDGPVSAEVAATEADAMIAEGRKLAEIADNIAVKVPLNWDGLKAAVWRRQDGECHALFLSQSGASRRQGRRYLYLALHRASGRYQPRRHGPDRRDSPDL